LPKRCREQPGTAPGGPQLEVGAPQQSVHWLTGYGVKNFMERQADSRRKALEAGMTLSDADTLLVLELVPVPEPTV